MRINSLRLISYRNYKDSSFSFDPYSILIYGKNGQGKTNILEAIYAGAIGKSYRASNDNELIMFTHKEASIKIDFVRKDVPQELSILFSLEGRKKILFNNNPIKQKELLGILNTVIFSPDNLQIIKGNPKLRRNFIDLELSQVDNFYYRELLTYQRILQQRNSILKDGFYKKQISFDAWDIQLSKSASYLVQKRLKSLEKINILLGLMHRRLTSGKENLTLLYEQPYSEGHFFITEEDFYKGLQKSREKDLIRKSTTIGPHLDDLIFSADGMNLKKFGSQGQQRTAILALKLSELEFIKSETGEYPILLLDDVLSELDRERRDNLLDFIHKRVQTFITTTDIKEYQDIKNAQFIKIVGGQYGEN